MSEVFGSIGKILWLFIKGLIKLLGIAVYAVAKLGVVILEAISQLLKAVLLK